MCVYWRAFQSDLPRVAAAIDGRERHATIFDLKEGFVFQVEGAKGSTWGGLWESNDSIVIDYGTALEGSSE